MATILIVEDNESNMELIRDVLQYHGYTVLTAADGHKCMSLLQTNLPQLILMDVQLPEKDGYTLTSEIKQQQAYQAIPVVALTAFAMDGDKEKALAAGCAGVITKPIDIIKFIEEIKAYLK